VPTRHWLVWRKKPREFLHKAGDRLFLPKEDFTDHLMEQGANRIRDFARASFCLEVLLRWEGGNDSRNFEGVKGLPEVGVSLAAGLGIPAGLPLFATGDNSSNIPGRRPSEAPEAPISRLLLLMQGVGRSLKRDLAALYKTFG